jgi:hypothetical protein
MRLLKPKADTEARIQRIACTWNLRYASPQEMASKEKGISERAFTLRAVVLGSFLDFSRTGSTGAMRVGTAAGVGQKFQNGRAAGPAIPTPLCSRNARLSICLIWSFTRVPSSRTFSVQGDVASQNPEQEAVISYLPGERFAIANEPSRSS